MHPTDPNPSALYRFLQSKILAGLVLAGSICLLVIFTIAKLKAGLYFDDTFMFVRYAQNILDHGTYGWNAFEHTYGCTNIPFTYFVALLKLLHIDKVIGLSATLLFSSLFWAVISLLLMYRIVNQLIGTRPGVKPWLTALMIGTLSVAPVFIYNVITGMDTTFSLFFIVLMIHQLFRYQRKPGALRMLSAAAAAYFVFLSRPDCGLYTILFPGLFLLDKKMTWKQIISFYVALGIFLVADTLVKYLYFGNPLPLPYYVKKGGFYKGYMGKASWNPIEYTFDFLFNFGFPFIVLLLTAGARDLKKFMVFGLPLFLSIAYYFTVTQIMGFHSRYYLPSMPFFIIGVVYAFSGMPELKLQVNRLVLPAVWVTFLLFLQFFGPVYALMVQNKSGEESKAFVLPEIKTNRLNCKNLDYKSGIWEMQKLISLLPDTATVGATEYGWLSVKAPKIKFLDLCGLHNEDMALHGYNDRFLTTWQPTLIWMPPGDYTSLRKEIITGAWFQSHYDYYPDALNYGVAILKSSPRHDLLRDKMIEWNCR